MDAWDPNQYLKFSSDRARPAIDLLSRIETVVPPRSIVDLGCGAGNITRVLAERWPAARVAGVDSSADMLREAMLQETHVQAPAIAWEEADLRTWAATAPVDVLYSNAALHWLDDHPVLFPGLVAMLAGDGVLAVQMPRNHGAASHTCMIETAEQGPWRERLRPVLRPSPVASPEVYYDILAPHVGHLDIWETVYMHVFDGDNPVVEWTKGTALRPLLDALEDDERDAFLTDYGVRIRAAYAPRADGKTVFPFRRLFIVARR